MKAKKYILAMIVILSISSSLMVGCTTTVSNEDLNNSEQASENSSNNSIEAKKNDSIKLFEDYSKKASTVEGLEEVKKDLSQKFSKAITDSGYKVVNSNSDGSFVVSINGFEKPPEKDIRSLFYSMSEDNKKGKSVVDILCAKEYPENKKLAESDKYIKFMYNIFKSLTNTDLTEKDFSDKVIKIFNEGVGSVELPYMNDIHVEVNKVKKSTKVLKLSLEYEFDISSH
ncbi:hypothetical protein IC175_12665 [Clostridioides sp. ES-S-0123-01]|uniref:hypothetical protein n=1 Tax=Clostridioides sp. ES-S-0123-01 TaxID=2770783 RepID=UPI001D12BF6F|nr:hypothetical protein [Clostridioides sp. ES-S-0123-01]